MNRRGGPRREKPGTSLEFRRPAGPLRPAEEFDVLEFDLGRLFDIQHTGSYAIWLSVTPSGDKPAKPAQTRHDFINLMIADPLPMEKPTKQ